MKTEYNLHHTMHDNGQSETHNVHKPCPVCGRPLAIFSPDKPSVLSHDSGQLKIPGDKIELCFHCNHQKIDEQELVSQGVDPAAYCGSLTVTGIMNFEDFDWEYIKKRKDPEPCWCGSGMDSRHCCEREVCHE